MMTDLQHSIHVEVIRVCCTPLIFTIVFWKYIGDNFYRVIFIVTSLLESYS